MKANRPWPVLDASKLRAIQELETADNGARLLGLLMGIFVDGGEATLAAMREAWARQCPSEMARLAHKLKASSAQLGGEALRYLCEEVEEQGASLSEEKAEALLSSIELAYRDLNAQLQAYLGKLR